jgi:hypothetical protein
MPLPSGVPSDLESRKAICESGKLCDAGRMAPATFRREAPDADVAFRWTTDGCGRCVLCSGSHLYLGLCTVLAVATGWHERFQAQRMVRVEPGARACAIVCQLHMPAWTKLKCAGWNGQQSVIRTRTCSCAMRIVWLGVCVMCEGYPSVRACSVRSVLQEARDKLNSGGRRGRWICCARCSVWRYPQILIFIQ